ncbi:thioredoxin family protein [Coprobacter sp.]
MRLLLWLFVTLLPVVTIEATGILVPVAQQEVQNEGIIFRNLTFDQALKNAKSENKIIFIDCYTVWCGPCKHMANVVFKDQALAEYFNKNFINLKFDMEKGEGITLRKRFGVDVFPTFIFVNGDGEIIHRIVGGSDAPEFLEKAKEGTGTKGLVKMQERYKKGDRDTQFVIDYIGVLGDAYLTDEAEAVSREFIEGKETEMLDKESYFNIFINYIDDPNSNVFQYVLAHKGDFVKKYGKQQVEQKLYRVWASYPVKTFVKKDGDTYKMDEVAMKAYIKQMKKYGVKEYAQIELLTRMSEDEKTGNWKAYVDRGTKILTNKNMSCSEQELYTWAVKVDRKCSDMKLRIRTSKWFDKVLTEIKDREVELTKNSVSQNNAELVQLREMKRAFVNLQQRLTEPKVSR